jgi:hypothetical protein
MAKRRTRTETGKARNNRNVGGVGFPFPQFEPSKLEMPDGFRDAAVQWVDEGKRNFDAAIKSAGEAYGKTWFTAARCTADCTAKFTEAVHNNTDAAFDIAHDLMAAKSLPEVMEISSAGVRQQYERLASQNQQLWSFAQQTAIETMRSFATAMPSSFAGHERGR